MDDKFNKSCLGVLYNSLLFDFLRLCKTPARNSSTHLCQEKKKKSCSVNPVCFACSSYEIYASFNVSIEFSSGSTEHFRDVFV